MHRGSAHAPVRCRGGNHRVSTKVHLLRRHPGIWQAYRGKWSRRRKTTRRRPPSKEPTYDPTPPLAGACEARQRSDEREARGPAREPGGAALAVVRAASRSPGL
jgi:hypothetical protein